MFCRSCGKEISQTQSFCTYCGAKAETTPIQYAYPSVNNTQPTFNNSNTFGLPLHISCASQGFWALFLEAVTGLFFIIFGIFLMCVEGFSFIGILGGLLAVMGIAFAILGIAICVKSQQRFCDVKYDSISGITCGKTNFTNESYDINYSDILSVNKNDLAKLITVHTKDGRKVNIQLPIKYVDFVYSTLQQKFMSQK